MRPHHQSHFSSATTTVTYTFRNNQSTPPPQPPSPSYAAVKIQSVYRSYKTRTLIRKISAVDSSSTHLQHMIQRQETVDAIRRDLRERVRINEALMGLLLTLDRVQTVDPVVRELRKSVTRKIVGMQEIVDAVVAHDIDGCDGFWVWEMEEEVCRMKGGDEMERFCADHLGFRCLQRFLHDH